MVIPKRKKIIKHPEFELEEFEMSMCTDPEKDPLEGTPYTEWEGSRRRRRR